MMMVLMKRRQQVNYRQVRGAPKKGAGRPSVRENDHHRRSDDAVNLADDLMIKMKKMMITIMVMNQL